MTANNKIIFVGGGGHAKVLIDLIRKSQKFRIIGILDPRLEKRKMISGIPVLGSDDLLPVFFRKGVKNVCIAIGSVRDNNKRKQIYKKVRRLGFKVPYLIHPHSIVSENNTVISDAVQIMAGAVIQTDVSLGENTIINTGAIVEHDCSVGRHVHVCPGSVISGGCEIGDGAFIGAGATIIQGLKIGKGSLVGAGSVVIRDIPDGATVKGAPAG